MRLIMMILTNLFQISAACSASDMTEVFHLLDVPLPRDPQILGVSRNLNSSKTEIRYVDVILYAACALDCGRPTFPQKSLEAHRYDFFLGGACNPTTWRKEVVIPILDRFGFSYYNPQVDEWSPDLIDLERNAKSTSDILLFVFENWKTRGLVSLLEVTYFASQRRPLVLSVSKVEETNGPSVAGEGINQLEYYCLEEAMNYFLEIIKRHNIPCFSDVKSAVNYAINNSHLRFKLSGQLTNNEKQLMDKVLFVSHMFREIIGRIPESADDQIVYEQIRQGFQRLNVELTSDRDFVNYWNKVNRFDLLCSLYAQYILKQQRSPLLLTSLNEYLASKFLKSCNTSKYSLLDSQVTNSSVESKSSSSVEGTEFVSQFDCYSPGGSNSPLVSTSVRTPVSSAYSSSSLSSSTPTVSASATPKSDSHISLNNVDDFKYTKTDVYIAGILKGNEYCHFLLDTIILPKLANANLSYYKAIERPNYSSTGNNQNLSKCYQDLESKQLNLRQNSRILLYIIDNSSFHLITILEAVYSMGSHLSVVLFVQMFNSTDNYKIILNKSNLNSFYEYIFNDCIVQHLPIRISII
ncbi:unnamed protein product [Heterobilharzia americana]|nr:unnamed protein product [Heterobilharzia americana]